MTDKEKDQLVEKVMKGFDFKRVHALNILSDHKLTDKTIDDLKSRARKLLLMALLSIIRIVSSGGLVGCTTEASAPVTTTSGASR